MGRRDSAKNSEEAAPAREKRKNAGKNGRYSEVPSPLAKSSANERQSGRDSKIAVASDAGAKVKVKAPKGAKRYPEASAETSIGSAAAGTASTVEEMVVERPLGSLDSAKNSERASNGSKESKSSLDKKEARLKQRKMESDSQLVSDVQTYLKMREPTIKKDPQMKKKLERWWKDHTTQPLGASKPGDYSKSCTARTFPSPYWGRIRVFYI